MTDRETQNHRSRLGAALDRSRSVGPHPVRDCCFEAEAESLAARPPGAARRRKQSAASTKLRRVRILSLVTDSDAFRSLRLESELDLDLFTDGFSGDSMATGWSAPSVRLEDAGLPVGDL